MAINGISSSMNSLYSYQSTINQMRLAQAITNNPKLADIYSNVTGISGSSQNSFLSSGIGFVKEYSSTMSDLMNAANALRSSNTAGVMNDLTVTSSNTDVADAVEKLPVRDATSYELNISQIARAQVNESNGTNAFAAAQEDMNFTVSSGAGSVNVQVNASENGQTKTNLQMLREAADQINRGYLNITASVLQKDGIAALKLEGNSTGESYGFSVSGQLGAAAGADSVQTEASNAKYSITTGDTTTQYESEINEVSLDFTRMDVTLKGTGQTTIRADIDSGRVASAINDLVNVYNTSLELLGNNYDRGSGVYRQLRNLVMGIGSEQSLAQLRITTNEDATLRFDENIFTENLKNDPDLTKKLISGTGGIAETAFNKASSGLSTNSSSLINADLSSANTVSSVSTFDLLSMYSRNGAYNLNNYAAVGMMLNYLI